MKNLPILVVIAVLISSLGLEAQQQMAPKPGSSAPSDFVNEGLPKWLRFSGEVRARVEGFTGGGFKPNNEDAYLLTRLRLNMKVQPTSWLKFVLQGQDAHALWKNVVPVTSTYQDTMDLRLGYVEIGDAEKKTFALRAGRQELAFGEERLIGVADWTNTTRTFDALRGTLRLPIIRLDAFAASVVKIHDGQFNEVTPGTYLYGLYGSTEKLLPKTTVEPFFLWRRTSNLLQETGGRGIMNFGTVGFRWVGKLPMNLDYGTEIARQSGSLGTDSIGAWAGHWVLGYTVPSKWKPRFSAEYNYASGDKNSTDGHRGTFDQLYPTGHDKYGLADQVGWKNIENLRGGVDLKPSVKWLIKGRYDAWWLADPHDALYDAGSNVVARVANRTAGRFVGQELDISGMYDLTKQWKAGAGFGHIFTGTFLNNATPGEAYNFPYAMLNYKF
jgi:hypothetical protein